jgi:hypothetical protein
MINTVSQQFDKNIPVWNGNVLVVGGVNNLKKTSEAIKAAAQKQQTNLPTGYTAAKERARDELESLLYQTSIRLRSYARTTNNDVLIAQLEYSQSALGRIRHNDLLTYGRVVVEACKQYLPELLVYQIDDMTINELSQSIDRTETLFSERNTIVSQRVEATADLEKLFSVARKQLKILDDLVEGYIDDETFVITYFQTRKIHDLKKKKTKKEDETPPKEKSE